MPKSALSLHCLFVSIVFIYSVIPALGGEFHYREAGMRYCVVVSAERSADLRAALNAWNATGRSGSAFRTRLFDSLGFFAPRVDTILPDSVRIDAGPRAVIDSIVCTGDTPLRIDSAVSTLCPVLFNTAVITLSESELALFMARRGYPFASIEAAVELQVSAAGNAVPAPAHVVVRLRVTPDRKCVFSGPLFSGSYTTKTAQLQQDVAFAPGELFDIEKVNRTRERLLSRSYIVSVDVLPPMIGKNTAGTAGTTSDTAPQRVGVPMQVTDRSGMGLDGAVALDGGAGKETDLTGTLDFSILNIFGVGDRGALYYRGDKTGHLLELNISKISLLTLPLLIRLDYGLEVREGSFGRMQGGARILYELMTRWAMGGAVRGNETTDSTGKRISLYYGGEFIIRKQPEPLYRGNRSVELSITTGTGVATRSDRRYTRSLLDFSAGTQVPFLRMHALHGRLVTNNMFTQEPEVPRADLYRVGGVRSIRGYSDDQWSFRSVIYGQAEYLLYFAQTGAAYVFADGGVGFARAVSLQREDRTLLLGYGIGARFPVAIGSATVEWARNRDDTKSPGRIHVRVSNTLAAIADW